MIKKLDADFRNLENDGGFQYILLNIFYGDNEDAEEELGDVEIVQKSKNDGRYFLNFVNDKNPREFISSCLNKYFKENQDIFSLDFESISSMRDLMIGECEENEAFLHVYLLALLQEAVLDVNVLEAMKISATKCLEREKVQLYLYFIIK